MAAGIRRDAQEPIPQFDLRAQYALIQEDVRSAIQRVLDSQQFILGKEVSALEEEMAGLCEAPYAVAVASGTDALILALRAAGVGPGDEVIVPAFGFIATAGAVTALGARPVFADIHSGTFNLAPEELPRRLSPKTKAVIVVHLYGLPADMQPILDFAASYHLPLIEDNAQALGAAYHGRKTGSLGEFGCISFYPTKNLGAYGDAGMILAHTEEHAARLRRLRNHGQTSSYVSQEHGWNSRLDEIQAAILRVKLRFLPSWQAARQAHAREYDALLSGIPGVVTPKTPEGCQHVFHQYTIRVPRRDAVQASLAGRGIGSRVYYPVPLPFQPLYAALPHLPGDFPAAERAASEVLSLPMYPELQREQISRVAEALAAAVASQRD